MAEVITVVGLIGSVANIIEAIREVYNVAKDASRLPEAFSVVNDRIPVVLKTLSLAGDRYRGNEDEPEIRASFNSCKEKAEDLKCIFDQVCAVEADGVLRRYQKALRTLKPGRRDKVETLFKHILDTLQTLQAFHIFKNVIPVEELEAALDEISGVEPSIADSASTTIYSSGTGAMFNNGPGELRVKQQNGDGNYQAEVMHFGAPELRNAPRDPTIQNPFYDPIIRRKRIDSSIYMPRPLALERLENKLSKKARGRNRSAVVVHGMGGTGKTQLVLHYVEQHLRKYSMVIWIDCSSPRDFVRSCVRVCYDLRLTNMQHHEQSLSAMVPQRSPDVHELLSWLDERKASDNWLVVLDNVDDLSWGIVDVIPRGNAGTLIATSRDSHTALKLGCGKVSLESMEVNEASQFLRNAAFPELETPSDELGALCTEVAGLLDCLPLAVHLAAASIQVYPKLLSAGDEYNSEDCCEAVAHYIKTFNTDKDLLLLHANHELIRSPYRMTVMTTFETTLSKLKENEKTRWGAPAMKLLGLLASLEDAQGSDLHRRFEEAYVGLSTGHQFYANHRLPRWLSKVLTGESTVLTRDEEQYEWDSHGYCEGIEMLQRYGLIRPLPGGPPQTYPLHKLVRWRAQKEIETQLETYLEEYAVLLELALASKAHDVQHVMEVSDELADLYYNIHHWPYAEGCARVHLQEELAASHGRRAKSVRSLERLIHILQHMDRPDAAENELFFFVKDASDRSAVLDALSPDSILMLREIFLRQPDPKDKRQPSRNELLMPPDRNESTSLIAAPINTLGGASQALQRSTWATQQSTWTPHDIVRPERRDRRLGREVSNELNSRKFALQKAAAIRPDLVTLFEVLSMGSQELVTDYMRHVDSDTVQYRDPVSFRTVLHFVVAYGQLSEVKRCLEAGSDVNALDRYGTTPLHIAGMLGRAEIFRTLKDAHGDMSIKDYSGRTPRDYANHRLNILPAVEGSTQSAALHALVQEIPALAPPPPRRPLPSPSLPSKVFTVDTDYIPLPASRYAFVESGDDTTSLSTFGSQSRRSSRTSLTSGEDLRQTDYATGKREVPDAPHSFYIRNGADVFSSATVNDTVQGASDAESDVETSLSKAESSSVRTDHGRCSRNTKTVRRPRSFGPTVEDYDSDGDSIERGPPLAPEPPFDSLPEPVEITIDVPHIPDRMSTPRTSKKPLEDESSPSSPYEPSTRLDRPSRRQEDDMTRSRNNLESELYSQRIDRSERSPAQDSRPVRLPPSGHESAHSSANARLVETTVTVKRYAIDGQPQHRQQLSAGPLSRHSSEVKENRGASELQLVHRQRSRDQAPSPRKTDENLGKEEVKRGRRKRKRYRVGDERRTIPAYNTTKPSKVDDRSKVPRDRDKEDRDEREVAIRQFTSSRTRAPRQEETQVSSNRQKTRRRHRSSQKETVKEKSFMRSLWDGLNGRSSRSDDSRRRR